MTSILIQQQSWQEICQQHPDKWVVLQNFQFKENSTEIQAGEVVAVIDDYSEAMDYLVTIARNYKGNLPNTFFTGELPEDELFLGIKNN